MVISSVFRTALILAGSGALLAGCQRDAAAPAKAPEGTEPGLASPQIAPPLPAPVLGRTELLSALDAAASDYAAGQAEGGELAGRRFVIRQPFGCPASRGQGDGVAQWTPADGGAELNLAPADWTQAPIVAEAHGDWEAVEGYWLSWPWLRGGECPAARGDPAELAQAQPARQTAGLAAVFTSEGARTARRNGRPYSFAIRAEGETPAALPPAGYRLVLEGRLAAFPTGRAIRCHARAATEQPVCVAAAEIDRVAFEDANGATLREWRTR